MWIIIFTELTINVLDLAQLKYPHICHSPEAEGIKKNVQNITQCPDLHHLDSVHTCRTRLIPHNHRKALFGNPFE